MVVMHGAHQLPKRRIAELMGVHPSTLRRTLKNAYTTGSVVKKPLQNGGRRALNGVDCAVRAPSYQWYFFIEDLLTVPRVAYRTNP